MFSIDCGLPITDHEVVWRYSGGRCRSFPESAFFQRFPIIPWRSSDRAEVERVVSQLCDSIDSDGSMFQNCRAKVLEMTHECRDAPSDRGG